MSSLNVIGSTLCPLSLAVSTVGRNLGSPLHTQDFSPVSSRSLGTSLEMTTVTHEERKPHFTETEKFLLPNSDSRISQNQSLFTWDATHPTIGAGWRWDGDRLRSSLGTLEGSEQFSIQPMPLNPSMIRCRRYSRPAGSFPPMNPLRGICSKLTSGCTDFVGSPGGCASCKTHDN